MKIKKLLFISMLCTICVNNVSAQMIDIMGSVGVGGAVNTGSIKSVGYARNKLNSTQLISDINMKMVDIQMTYDGRYQRMPVQNIMSAGRKITFAPVNDGRAVECKIHNVNESICNNLLAAPLENVSVYRIVSASGSKDVSRNEGMSKASVLCKNATGLSLIFQ